GFVWNQWQAWSGIRNLAGNCMKNNGFIRWGGAMEPKPNVCRTGVGSISLLQDSKSKIRKVFSKPNSELGPNWLKSQPHLPKSD
ncbi:MAG: hypothetical protein KC592_19050, partial [Nitrospira sp.]|nr:hypothetical protein [Nitrospira sp.]